MSIKRRMVRVKEEKIMYIVCGVIVGLLIGIAEFFLFKKDKVFPDLVFNLLKGVVLYNLLSLGIMKYILGVKHVFYLDKHGPTFLLKYAAFTLALGIIALFVQCIVDGKLRYKKESAKFSKGQVAGKVFTILAFALGVAAFTGTVWGKKTFGDVTPDQFLVNLKSPIVGTSDDIIVTIFEGPVFETALLTLLFALFVGSKRILVFCNKEKTKTIFNRLWRTIVSAVLAVATLIGGVVYGVVKFDLTAVYDAYMSDSKWVEENYVSPNDVQLTFPEKPRNLIHIYLESVENTYLNEELGGYMKDNLMPELTELAKEGISFSNYSDRFGGPNQTTGSGWSVAAMVNMETGLPLKIPMEANTYGTAGYFLPGAIALGDVLAANGYEQTIMFGADADFGGLTTYFSTHGDFNFMDYKAVKEKGLIPEDYYVWWGYEDDKLYEFAKDELTRLASTGKPFHFEMETADTHASDGYLSPRAKKIHKSQYANVISYSTKETVEFVRWIQQQDFYENTTIVLTGDHLSMDQKFFKNMDPSYRRSVFNLFLNTGRTAEHAYSREYAPFDFYPTILSSMGVQIEGDRLGLGTDLFSGAQTLVERDGVDVVNDQLTQRSNFYNDAFVAQNKTSTYIPKGTEK